MALTQWCTLSFGQLIQNYQKNPEPIGLPSQTAGKPRLLSNSRPLFVNSVPDEPSDTDRRFDL